MIEVELGRCRNLHTAAFSCSIEAGNPFVLTLLSYKDGTCGGYSESPLRLFHDRWQPVDAAEALGIDKINAHPDLIQSPPLGCVFPWNPQTPTQYAEFWTNVIAADYRSHGFKLDASHGWKAWGPVSAQAGEAEFQRLVRVYNGIQTQGFRRSPKFDGDIEGIVLQKEADFRVMVVAGQHRIAALSALGFKSAPIRMYPTFVRHLEAGAWPNVRAKLFTVEQALNIFERMFDGRQPHTSSVYETL